MLAWKGHEFGVIWGYGRKAGWVIGQFWKGEEEKEKRAAKLKFEQVKQVFIFLCFFFCLRPRQCQQQCQLCTAVFSTSGLLTLLSKLWLQRS